MKTKGWALAFIPFSAFFFYLALHVHWSDSEIWAVGVAREFLSGVNPSNEYKAFFNLVLRSVYIFAHENVGILNLARLYFAVVGLVLLVLSYFVTKKISDAKAAVWTVFLLGGSTLFLSQGFKVRSDLLAVLFQAAGVLYFLSLNSSEDRKKCWPQYLVGALLNLLMLLSTPKAVYHLAISFVFIFSVLIRSRSTWIKNYLAAAFAIPLTGVAVLAIWKRAEFSTALDFFIESYRGTAYHPAFWTAPSFVFVVDALIRNPIFAAFCVYGLLRVEKMKNWSAYAVPVGYATLASFVLILVHNDRLPFAIFSLLFFPFVLSGMALADMVQRGVRKPFTVGAVVAVVLGAMVFSTKMLQQANNAEQVQAIHQMEGYLARHQWPLYYDATAALPRDNRIFDFPAPEHENNKPAILAILGRPDLSLVFFGNRLFYYLWDLYKALDEKFFIQIGPGIFARSYVVRSTHVLDDTEWKKICASFANPKELFVYTGKNFLSVQPDSESKQSCVGAYRKVKTTEPFIAFTPFDPFVFPNGLSFSQIFDHRPFY